MTRVLTAGKGSRANGHTDVDLMMHLSDQARATRRPGQTLQERLLELRRQHEFVAPSDYAPQSGGAASEREGEICRA